MEVQVLSRALGFETLDGHALLYQVYMPVRAHIVEIGKLKISNSHPFVFIGGPDSLESMPHALFMAREIQAICKKLGIPYVFKASYDKANRTSIKSFRGVGLEKGLKILGRIKKGLKVPVTTDVHSPKEARLAGLVVDLIQIPALLSRQTDLIVAAAKTGKPINIKKGQFVAPHDIGNVAGKALASKNKKILLTERGYMFGYNNVVADMRSLYVMKETGFPVIFDASHTAQTPSSDGGVSGGDRALTPPLARAAVAVGVAGVFMEVHNNPDRAPVDGKSSLHLKDLEGVLGVLKKIDEIVKFG